MSHPSFQVSLRQEVCFFSSVPFQPVPPLVQTLQGYLRALEPLLPPEEFSHTRRMVQEFGRPGGLGAQLQEGLERRARHTKNWVCVCWIRVGNVADVRGDVGVILKLRESCCGVFEAPMGGFNSTVIYQYIRNSTRWLNIIYNCIYCCRID